MDEGTRNMMLGIDTANEIFSLWYELIYQRTLLSIVVEKAQHAFKGVTYEKMITEEDCAEARIEAQRVVQERFPVCKISFNETTQEQRDKRAAHLEHLRQLNEKLGGMFGVPNQMFGVPTDTQQESPSNTHQDSSEAPLSSPLPENAS